MSEDDRDPTDVGVSRVPPSEPAHPVGCVGGWLPDDAEGRPVPCPVCRHHLSRSVDREGRASWRVRREARTP